MAIKSIYVHPIQKQEIIDLLYGAIVEFCFYKLFSVLKIGPFISKLFGFDLIVFQDTV